MEFLKIIIVPSCGVTLKSMLDTAGSFICQCNLGFMLSEHDCFPEETCLKGRMVICLTFLFSLWGIVLRILAGCSPGEAVFLEYLTCGIPSVC